MQFPESDDFSDDDDEFERDGDPLTGEELEEFLVPEDKAKLEA